MTLRRSEPNLHLTLHDADAEEATEYVVGPEEVARMLGMSPHDVRELARQGKLRARRMGTRWRFRRDDVLIYLRRLSHNDKSI